MILCFKCGLYKQGLIHDLSKFSFTEFIPSIKYYQGNKSPIDKEKEVLGYSNCWLHHKGRNKHHFEYWYDLNLETHLFEQIPMPFNYLLESVCDRIAACKVYHKGYYKDEDAFVFLNKSISSSLMHKDTFKQFYDLLLYLKENGEKKAFQHYRRLYKNFKKLN